ncbi:unnamed protein product [Brachionus calyciflorus]|uniref:BHLH domain-containing protein n=1 Tax=Brachionus calyciflorus TaxID=104777 RepID=A0A813M1D5_9BILA|nr:unnamed protein product [Brachionus calyciflorus]
MYHLSYEKPDSNFFASNYDFNYNTCRPKIGCINSMDLSFVEENFQHQQQTENFEKYNKNMFYENYHHHHQEYYQLQQTNSLDLIQEHQKITTTFNQQQQQQQIPEQLDNQKKLNPYFIPYHDYMNKSNQTFTAKNEPKEYNSSLKYQNNWSQKPDEFKNLEAANFQEFSTYQSNNLENLNNFSEQDFNYINNVISKSKNDDKIRLKFGLSDENSCNDGQKLNYAGSKASEESELFRNGATQRERNRMHVLNDAFEDLRKIVPKTNISEHQRLSKIATLRLAIQYIAGLTSILQKSGGCKPIDPSLLPAPPKRRRRRKVQKNMLNDTNVEFSNQIEKN